MKKFVIFLILFPVILCAQQSNTKPKKKKQSVISFDDQLVEGNTKKPDLFYLLQKKHFKYQRLIKLRENFLPEISATAEDLEEQNISGAND